VSACGGFDVKGRVLGPSDPIYCDCRCVSGRWRATTAFVMEYRVYYANDLRDIAGSVIRAAEMQHVRDLQRFDDIAIARLAELERWSFVAKTTCTAACLDIKAEFRFRRIRYLTWDVIRGHDSAGAHWKSTKCYARNCC